MQDTLEEQMIFRGRFVFEWPIRIDPTQATNLNHARLQSWDEDKNFKNDSKRV